MKITDFGLATAAADASLSQSGTVAGTPQYMAPEQARGELLDYRADLFSLGSVLYAMCTGRAPFRAANSMAVLKRLCEDCASPIQEANPEIPDWLVAMIQKLHAKNPHDRIQSAAEVVERLGRRLAELQHPGEGLRSAESGTTELAVPHSANRYPQAGPSRRWSIVAAVLLCLCVGLGLSEATGTTQLASTAIRIFTPEGTLIVEVDDPGIEVTVEGDSGLVITGAGPQELRVRPGNYQVHAVKNGKPARPDRELVTITRGDREVVRVRLEAPSQAASPAVQQPLAPHEIRRFAGHFGAVKGLAFSADGRRVLSGAGDGIVRLWDVENGKELLRLPGHQGQVESVIVSPQGRHAFSCGYDGTVRFWDLEGGKELRRLDNHTEPVRAIALTRDGRRMLSGGWDKTMRLWDVEQFREIRRFPVHAHPVYSVAFSPDGLWALSGNQSPDSVVRLWNVEQGALARSFEGHLAGVYCVAFSPDGTQALSTGADQIVRIWEVKTGKPLRRLIGHSSDVISAAFSPDGRYVVSGSWDGTVRWWDLETGKELQRFEGHRQPVYCVAYSPKGRTVLSGGGDGSARLWRLPKPDAEHGTKRSE